MTVYVDLLFGLNTLINYLLLRGSAAMGGLSGKTWRMLAASAVGGLYAVAVVLPGWEFLHGTIWQMIMGAMMVTAAFGWKRNTVKQGLFFFALSFAFGGLVLLMVQAAEPDCVILGGRAYYAVTTPALLLLAGACYGLAALVLNGWGTHTGGDLVSLELELDGRSLSATALRDTGNTLRDPITGQGVLVAERQILRELLPDKNDHWNDDPVAMVNMLAERYPGMRFRLIPYEAVGTSHGLLPAVPVTVRQGKRQETMLLAFTKTELSAHGRFEILMGGAVR